MDVIHTIENQQSVINVYKMNLKALNFDTWIIDTYFSVKLWNWTWLEKLKGNISDGKNAKQSTLEVTKSTK
jgi:hypothetical protein